MTDKLNKIQILRYATGVTAAMAIAQGVGWFLSYLVPVLLIGFLKPPAPNFNIKDAVKFILIITIACLVGLSISKFTNYPLVYLLIIFLSLFWILYAREDVLPPSIKTWLLIAVPIIPLTSISSHSISLIIAKALLIGAIVTALLTILLFLIFPNPTKGEKELEKLAVKPPLSKEDRFSRALESSIVIFPLLLLFNLFQLNGAILILVFVALLSSMPDFAKNFKIGKFLIVGNLIGGIIAILFYEFMTLIPEFYFLILFTFLLSLIFANYIMSEKPIGKLLATAFSTVLIITGSVFSSDDQAGDKVWIRVLQIMIAVTYVVLAFGFIDKWKEYINNRKKTDLVVKSQN